MNNLKDKEFYALNLNDQSTKLCIQNALDKIAEIKLKQAEFQPNYLSAKQLFEEVRNDFAKVQAQWDEMEEGVRQQNILINAFSVFNSNTSPNKRLQRVADPESKPTIEKDMNVKWVEEATKVFTKENRFMTTEELWAEFAKDETIISRCNKNKTKFGAMKGIALDGLVRNALRGEKRKHGKQVISVYKDRLGLTDWLGQDGIPVEPAHLKPFLFADRISDERILKNIKYQAA